MGADSRILKVQGSQVEILGKQNKIIIINNYICQYNNSKHFTSIPRFIKMDIAIEIYLQASHEMSRKY